MFSNFYFRFPLAAFLRQVWTQRKLSFSPDQEIALTIFIFTARHCPRRSQEGQPRHHR